MILGHLIEDLRWSDKAGLDPVLMVTDWMYGGIKWSHTIKKDGGSYWGQVSYAYDKKTNLWIVSGENTDNQTKSDMIFGQISISFYNYIL